MRLTRIIGLLLLSAPLIGGCSDECSVGQIECVGGNAIRTCAGGGELQPSSRLTWQVKACPAPNSYCIDAKVPAAGISGPSCVASPAPVAECAGVDEACWKNDAVQCLNGYPSLAHDSACANACVTVPVGGQSCVFCSDGAAVADPSCAVGVAETCFDGAIYSCACGQRVSRIQSCTADGGDPSVCVTARDSLSGNPETFCALSSEPDPRCAGATSYCSDAGFVACRDGLATSVQGCTCGDAGLCMP